MEQTIVRRLFQLVESSVFLTNLAAFSAGLLPMIVLTFVFFLSAFQARARLVRIWAEVLLAVIFSRVVFTEGIRLFWDRPRPFEVLHIDPAISHEIGHAFPSGHAAFLFAIAFSLLLNRSQLSPHKKGWLFGAIMLIAAVLNGIARVAVGIHWPSDVVGGALIGLLGAFLARQILVKRLA